MNGKKRKEIEKIVRTMYAEVVDPLEFKRIMRMAKKSYILHKGKKK